MVKRRNRVRTAIGVGTRMIQAHYASRRTILARAQGPFIFASVVGIAMLFPEQARKAADFLFTVVRDEDYSTGFGITRSLMSGSAQEFVFGRNEPSLHHFHRWVDRLVADEPAAEGGSQR